MVRLPQISRNDGEPCLFLALSGSIDVAISLLAPVEEKWSDTRNSKRLELCYPFLRFRGPILADSAAYLSRYLFSMVS